MGIGRRLKILRESMGMNQQDLAKQLDVTPSAVGNYERDLSFPREEVLIKMFRVLECEPNELFSDLFSHTENQWQSHLNKYRELDQHGRELVDACTDIELNRCRGENVLTAVAARSFSRNETPAKISMVKREGAGSILDEPDYKER